MNCAQYFNQGEFEMAKVEQDLLKLQEMQYLMITYAE